MRVLTPFLLLLSIATVTPVMALDANEQAWVDAPPVTFRVYSVTWQPTYCLMQKEKEGGRLCAEVPARFKTHGIWPYSNSEGTFTNRHPQNCTPSKACTVKEACSESTLATELTRIKVKDTEQWLPENPDGMLKHEWKKHGSCSGKSMQAYFDDLINLRKPVVTVDEKTPAFKDLIDHSKPFKEIREIFPANTAFRCYTDSKGKQNLHEVFYLIDDNGQPYYQEKNLHIGIQCNEEQETLIRSTL
ncbi:ribonuclease T2 family protein [Pseudomonas sp. KU43P]|uniref:ribonuclease T2 family protein n=1 Tax=Pseudomonas sp. KU43P TaxID=2487887 RepID=UPI0012A8175D|nr:hypothetical protein [Pseudomonas sp. KU43P]BBH45910.1 hypothetical protein KU43P_23870 [Pseudomonas sp. KU43P]